MNSHPPHNGLAHDDVVALSLVPDWMAGAGRPRRGYKVRSRWRIWRGLALSVPAGLLLLASCATPIQVERLDPFDVHRELTRSVISTGSISGPTQIVLDRRDLSEWFKRDPEQAIALLHQTLVAGKSDPDILFALAEISFRHAEDSSEQAYYLAAAVYAFAFLFPDDPAQRPTGFDPRFRTACDLYNRGLTSSFVSADRSRVDLRSGRYVLPFGSIDLVFDPAGARWGELSLSEFTPADELRVIGLRDRYRRPGLGASLAASATQPVREGGFQISSDLKVPVTALMRLDLTHHALAQGRLHGRIDVYPAFEPSNVEIDGQPVPLEADTSAAFAYSLSDPKVWSSELAGFLQGDYFDQTASQLVGLEPYRPGQFPVVFIHGTASSSGRWADLINDLQSDPVLREHFQFWSFSYSTGNPTPFSALQLRTSLENAVRTLDPQGVDAPLHKMVLIGHSQGGLLAKLLVINSGSRIWDAISDKPPEEMRLSPQTATLLRRAAFVTPMPDVRRVIFIATPQHGSFVAESTVGQLLGRLVTLPLSLTKAFAETVSGNAKAARFAASAGQLGSVWSMTPTNPALKAFAAIPVSPSVAAHSIIAVEGNGPVETGDDGVVSYQSAHIDEAQSELVVRSGHSVQSNPHTVNEVRRILLLHLAENCVQGCAAAGGTGSHDRRLRLVRPDKAGNGRRARPAASPRRRTDFRCARMTARARSA